MYLDCLSQNVLILRGSFARSRLIFVFFANMYYYFSLRKHWPTTGGRSNMKLTEFAINNQDPSKILKIFELIVHLKKYMFVYMKNITRLLDSFNNNCGKFCSISSR